MDNDKLESFCSCCSEGDGSGKVRKISYMSLSQDEDSSRINSEELNEFESFHENFNSDCKEEHLNPNSQTPRWGHQFRDQKKTILQSAMDKGFYLRDGDDACTSGVSSTDHHELLEEAKDTLKFYDSNKENKLIWYAAYDTEMKNEIFEYLLSGCTDKTPISDKVSIKLENFDIVYSEISNHPGMVYLQQRTCGSCFVRLYLITKNQLLDIAKLKTIAYSQENHDFRLLESLLVSNKDSAIINPDLPYGYFLRVGDYKGTSIYTLTSLSLQSSSDIKNSCDPSNFYISEFFKGIAESFPNFSPDFLLYYINSKKGLRNRLSSQLMMELRGYCILNESHFVQPNEPKQEESIHKLLCDEDLDQSEYPRSKSQSAQKCIRKSTSPLNDCERRIKRQNSEKSSEFQHSLLKNKSSENVLTTSLENIPELSFEAKDVDVDIFLKSEENKPPMKPQSDQNKVFIVNRNEKTPVPEQDPDLFCDEELDADLVTHDYSQKPNFAGMISPDLIDIPSDISQFEKINKSDEFSHTKTVEGLEEFMKWGVNLECESLKNYLHHEEYPCDDSKSSIFTKGDQKNQNQEEFKLTHEETKLEEPRIQECSPADLPSINIPKRFVSSCQGEIKEKMLDRINRTCYGSLLRIDSKFLQRSQSCKASLLKFKTARGQLKTLKMFKKLQTLPHKNHTKRFFSEEKNKHNAPKKDDNFNKDITKEPKNDCSLPHLNKQEGSIESQCANCFQEIQLYTFAKNTPNLKRLTSSSPSLKNPIGTLTIDQKENCEHPANRTTTNIRQELCNTVKKTSPKSKRACMKNSGLKEHVKPQATKLYYLDITAESSRFKRDGGKSSVSSIQNIKHSSGFHLNKNKTHNMSYDKNNPISKVKKSQKETKIHPSRRIWNKRSPLANKSFMNYKNIKGKYHFGYTPKYRKSANRSKIKKKCSEIHNDGEKENMVKNNQSYSPVLGRKKPESISSNPYSDSPCRVMKPKRLRKRINYSEQIKCKHLQRSHDETIDSIETLDDSDLNKLLKLNLDLIQAFSEGIETSRSIISSLTSNNEVNKKELLFQLRKIENLRIEFQSPRYAREINQILQKIHIKE
ncbi:unnamed protein product [Moneuplotes crassus]|uniref:Uncharacterized protein n=1 Tax=Euplotes crassus TaxID=5936 RepID=A0AAD1UP94_EUPCR|nr:unnamed protein product [Moneuplotes crassus]